MNKYCILVAIMAVFVCTNYTANAGYIKEINDSSKLDTSVYIQKASDMFMRKDFNRTIEFLDEALRVNPKNPQLYLNRGFVKQILGDYDSAMQEIIMKLFGE